MPGINAYDKPFYRPMPDDYVPFPLQQMTGLLELGAQKQKDADKNLADIGLLSNKIRSSSRDAEFLKREKESYMQRAQELAAEAATGKTPLAEMERKTRQLSQEFALNPAWSEFERHAKAEEEMKKGIEATSKEIKTTGQKEAEQRNLSRIYANAYDPRNPDKKAAEFDYTYNKVHAFEPLLDSQLSDVATNAFGNERITNKDLGATEFHKEATRRGGALLRAVTDNPKAKWIPAPSTLEPLAGRVSFGDMTKAEIQNLGMPFQYESSLQDMTDRLREANPNLTEDQAYRMAAEDRTTARINAHTKMEIIDNVNPGRAPSENVNKNISILDMANTTSTITKTTEEAETDAKKVRETYDTKWNKIYRQPYNTGIKSINGSNVTYAPQDIEKIKYFYDVYKNPKSSAKDYKNAEMNLAMYMPLVEQQTYTSGFSTDQRRSNPGYTWYTIEDAINNKIPFDQLDMDIQQQYEATMTDLNVDRYFKDVVKDARAAQEFKNEKIKEYGGLWKAVGQNSAKFMKAVEKDEVSRAQGIVIDRIGLTPEYVAEANKYITDAVNKANTAKIEVYDDTLKSTGTQITMADVKGDIESIELVPNNPHVSKKATGKEQMGQIFGTAVIRQGGTDVKRKIALPLEAFPNNIKQAVTLMGNLNEAWYDDSGDVFTNRPVNGLIRTGLLMRVPGTNKTEAGQPNLIVNKKYNPSTGEIDKTATLYALQNVGGKMVNKKVADFDSPQAFNNYMKDYFTLNVTKPN